MFEKIMSEFNRNKKSKGVVPQPEQSPETENTLRQLHQTRQELNEIYESLKSINFDEIAKRGALEQAKLVYFIEEKDPATGQNVYNKVERSGTKVLNELKEAVDLLKKKLETEDAAELLKAQTRNIDTRLLDFSDMLNHSLTSTPIDLDTAKACVTGLIYGITEGHRPMPKSWDNDKIKKELDIREKRIYDYKKIIDVSEEIMKLRDTRKKLIDQNNQTVGPKFLEAQNALEEDRKANITIHNEIKGLSGNDINKMITDGKMIDEHLQAWVLLSNVSNLHKIHEQIKNQIKFFDDNIKKFDVSIESIKTTVALENVAFNEKLHRQIDEAINSIPDKLLITQATSFATQKSIDMMSAKFKEALNSYDMALALIKTAQEFEEFEQFQQQKEEREKENKAARIAEIIVQSERQEEEEKEEERRDERAIERERMKQNQINKPEEIKQEQIKKTTMANPPKKVRKMK